MNFVEIEDGTLINFDNVTTIRNFNNETIRICFIGREDFIDIPIDKEDFDRVWKWLNIKVSNNIKR